MSFEVYDDSQSCLPMWGTTGWHKLANNTNCKRDIRLSDSTSLLSVNNFTLRSIGVSTYFEPINSILSRMSNTYFYCNKLIPSLECTTSIPRKYSSFPRSLVWNCDGRKIFNSSIPLLTPSDNNIHINNQYHSPYIRKTGENIMIVWQCFIPNCTIAWTFQTRL